MLKERRIITIIVCCTFFVTLVSIAAAADNMFVCDLEVSKVGPKPADTEARGSVVFHLDENGQEIVYKLMVEKIQDVYMAHLHIGPDGKEGQLAAWLYPTPGEDHEGSNIEGEFNGILAEGVLRPEDLEGEISFNELIHSLNDGNTYVNVHTKEFIMGAVRGQVYSEKLASQMEKNPTTAIIR